MAQVIPSHFLNHFSPPRTRKTRQRLISSLSSLAIAAGALGLFCSRASAAPQQADYSAALSAFQQQLVVVAQPSAAASAPAYQCVIPAASAPDPGSPSACVMAGVQSMAIVVQNFMANYKDPASLPAYGDVWPMPSGQTADANMTLALQQIAQMAALANTPLAGPAYYRNPILAKQINDALKFYVTKRFTATTPQTGNWWSWEIGSPRAVVQTLLALNGATYDLNGTVTPILEPAVATASLRAILGQFADPTRRGRAAGGMIETGSNLTDKLLIWLQAGLLSQDAAKVQYARDNLAGTLAFAANGANGFHTDGSYTDHGGIASQSGYGSYYVFDMSQATAALANTTWTISGAQLDFLFDRLTDSFEPFLYKGRLISDVSGRAMSRIQVTDFYQAAQVTRAMTLLQQSTKDDARRLRLQGDVKYLVNNDVEGHIYDTLALGAMADAFIQENIAPVSGATASTAANSVCSKLTSNCSPAIYSQSPLTRETDGSRIYPQSDRVVHRRPGYFASISAVSTRTLFNDYMNAEDVKGWHQNTGAFYFYTTPATGNPQCYRARQQGAAASAPDLSVNCVNYDGQFWATVDPYRIPGVTALSQKSYPRTIDKGGTLHKGLTTWVGGASLNNYSVYGMDLKGQTDFAASPAAPTNSLVGKKSWFLFDNEIVFLGAGITAAAGQAPQTTVENRQISAPVSVTGGVANPYIATLPNVGSYVIYNPKNVVSLNETRTSSWGAINPNFATNSAFQLWLTPATPADAIPETANQSVSAKFYTLYIDHSASTSVGSNGYEYAFLPGYDSKAASSYSSAAGYKTIGNTVKVQAVLHKNLNIWAANFFAAAATTDNSLSASAPASVILQKSANAATGAAGTRTIAFSISDPQQTATSTSVVLNIAVTGAAASAPTLSYKVTSYNVDGSGKAIAATNKASVKIGANGVLSLTTNLSNLKGGYITGTITY